MLSEKLTILMKNVRRERERERERERARRERREKKERVCDLRAETT